MKIPRRKPAPEVPDVPPLTATEAFRLGAGLLGPSWEAGVQDRREG